MTLVSFRHQGIRDMGSMSHLRPTGGAHFIAESVRSSAAVPWEQLDVKSWQIPEGKSALGIHLTPSMYKWEGCVSEEGGTSWSLAVLASYNRMIPPQGSPVRACFSLLKPLPFRSPGEAIRRNPKFILCNSPEPYAGRPFSSYICTV